MFRVGLSVILVILFCIIIDYNFLNFIKNFPIYEIGLKLFLLLDNKFLTYKVFHYVSVALYQVIYVAH